MSLQQLLEQERVADGESLGRLVEAAAEEGSSLAAVLVDRDVIAEDALADLVARAISSVVIEVHLGALDAEAVHLVPEHLARRHLAVAISRGASDDALRVAFADPLDEAAVRQIREATGMSIEPLVATVSGLRQTIDREYGARSSTQIIEGRAAMAHEDTQQIASYPGRRGAGSEPPIRTAPMHRIENEAPIEQRHEALLLALVEAGVLTRSDYIAALKRLRGRG